MMRFSSKKLKFHLTILVVWTNETHIEFKYILANLASGLLIHYFRHLMADAPEAVYNVSRAI